MLSTLFVAALLAHFTAEGEGSLAAATEGRWIAVVEATLLTCVLEAFTKQIDNLVLPLMYAATLELAQCPVAADA